MKEIYNIELKEAFLSEYPAPTSKTYRYAFYRCYLTEKVLGRDLYTFTPEEIIDSLYSANHTTINSIRLTFKVFKYYINWAIQKGVTTSNINVITTITDDELKYCIANTKKLYVSEEELVDMEREIVNYQDKVILRCIFEGVSGESWSELLNLKLQDIDFEKNVLLLEDDKNGQRMIKVSETCINFIKGALREEIYYNKNGTSLRRVATSRLVKNDYVIKGTLKYNVNHNRASKQVIYNRIKTLSDFFNLEYIIPNNIQTSGMLKHARDFLIKYGQLEKAHLKEIAEQYGMRLIDNNGYNVYNYTILRQEINLENILNLYS